MRLRRGIFPCAVLAMVLTSIAPAADQQWAEIGDLKLESGEVIRNCRVGYRTHGALNAAKSNAILWPTWFTGTTAQLEGFIGKGKLLDTERYFVVAVDALGDGVSSSPSNSAAQPRMQFPKFTIRDMVNSQHRLLTEKLGISHLRAVMGISMGGMQTFQWLTAYPDFMDRAIPIVGTPRLGTSDVLLWSAEAAAIRNDKAWEGGNYTQNPKLEAVQFMHQYALETPAYRNLKTRPEGARTFVSDTGRKAGEFDANNWLRQLEAMLSQDIYAAFGGSIEQAAQSVRAKVMVVAAPQDHMVAPEEGLRFAAALGVEPVLLTGDCGHMATSCEAANLEAAVQAFLR